jgi:hypothetical protein
MIAPVRWRLSSYRTGQLLRSDCVRIAPLSQGLASLLTCPDFCPACPLRGCNSLASCFGNISLFPARFSRAQVDFPKRCQCSGHAVQLILKSGAFLLELTDYRLHQCR